MLQVTKEVVDYAMFETENIMVDVIVQASLTGIPFVVSSGVGSSNIAPGTNAYDKIDALATNAHKNREISQT